MSHFNAASVMCYRENRRTRDSQIKQLYLTHHDPDNSDVQLEERCDQIQAEYGSAYELVTLARDEMVVELT